MDIAAIVASVGSFVVSERVIKAKATVLFGLFCLACYDLSIHSNDPVTLRVYRGPGLIAISFILSAFCLRSWRRNGIACDELLFLPGTAYAEKAESKDEIRLPLGLRHGDDAISPIKGSTESPGGSDDEECIKTPVSSRNISNNLPSASSSIQESCQLETITPLPPPFDESPFDEESDLNVSLEEIEMLPLNIEKEPESKTPVGLWRNCRRTRRSKSISPPRNNEISRNASPVRRRVNFYQRIKEQSQIRGIARFFSSSRESNEYAPSGPIVASAGLDLCMPVLLNFHMFVMMTHTDSETSGGIPPQVLPLIFLSILMLRSCVPFGPRKRFWKRINRAIAAPFSTVTFRDELIGEVATSMVRPLQDIFFAIFYYFASIYGIFSGKIELEDTGSVLTHNMLLHNVVLPTCAVLPLLCRFLQTLRKAYDEQRRWPYLGNAFKYLTATLVIFYGMTHNEEERSSWWIYCFAVCLIYQIWWDIVIDWELLRFVPRDELEAAGVCLPFVPRIRLRSKRLFKSNRSYWRIIFFDVICRFTWMISFIPAYHLNISGEIENTFSMDVKSFVGFGVSFVELLRRCSWVIIRLELETIKITNGRYAGNSYAAKSSRIQYSWFAPGDNGENHASQRNSMKWAAYRLLAKRLFFLELIVWLAAFVGLGFWVAALI